MRIELNGRKEIEILINSFYEKVLHDPLLKPVFVDIAEINLEKHLPILYDFWEAVLLGTPGYKGNPMETHLILNNKIRLTETLFNKWLDLFTKTIDENFFGNKAEEAKARAKTIAQLMRYKIEEEYKTKGKG